MRRARASSGVQGSILDSSSRASELTPQGLGSDNLSLQIKRTAGG